MKCTAQDESRVANIAQGEAKCYICHGTLIKTHLMNKQMCFFDKNVLVEPEFYNYSSIL